MSRRIVLSKRNEKAKRRNANEDNLLQLEMNRFEKEHNKEMKSILLERQIAKEAMSDFRRHRVSSLLAVRLVLDNSLSSLSTKSCTETKPNHISCELQNYESREEIPYLSDTVKKTFNVFRQNNSENFNITWLPPSKNNTDFGRSRTRAQTFSEGTRNALADSKYCSSSQYATGLRPIFFCNQEKKRWLQPSAKDATTILKESDGEEQIDTRPRSRTDSLLFLNRRPVGLEKRYLTASQGPKVPIFKGSSPVLLLRREQTSCSMDSKVLKRGSLELPCVPSKLSASRSIAKFGQTGNAATAAQRLLSHHQLDKAVQKATENLIAQREKKEKTRRDKHQQLKEDMKKGQTCHLRGRFFTIAQPP